MANLIETARALADAFEVKARDNGEGFYCLKDGSPDWMTDALRAAHDGGDMMPNDWSYRLAHGMAQHIAESLEYDAAQDLSDIVSEGADSLVPCYNGERLAWLASHLSRAGFVDDAAMELGITPDGGILEMIGVGIYAELRMIGAALVEAIEGQVDEDEEE